MKRWLRKFVWHLASAILLSCSVARAAEVWHSSTVKWVYPQADGTTVVLVFDAESPSCSSTASPKYYHVTVGQNGMTAEGLKTFTAMALMALATDKELVIAFEASSSNCYVNRGYIRR